MSNNNLLHKIQINYPLSPQIKRNKPQNFANNNNNNNLFNLIQINQNDNDLNNINTNNFYSKKKNSPLKQKITNNNNIKINNNNIINNNSNQNLMDSQIDSIFNQISHQISNKENHSGALSLLIEKTGLSLFLKIIKTHKGSLNLQKLLEIPPSLNEINLILKIICNNLIEIICDNYSNYFLQKFFPFCSLNHRLILYKFIKPNFLYISNDLCGNHSLQCLISLQNSKEEEKIIKECVENNLLELSLGSNSSHVIQKIIKNINENKRDYINNFIISNLMELCLDANGICVVKEFINNTKNDVYRMSIISIFEVETNKLTYNQYGNFGIQELINVFGENYCKKIINKIVDHIINFSMSKFSSNVVDFVIDYLSKNNFFMFTQVLKKIFLNKKNFNEMIKNKFATFVIENCLEIINKIDNEFFDNLSKNKKNKNIDNNNNNNNNDNYSESESSCDDNENSIENNVTYEIFESLKNKIYLALNNNPNVNEKKKIIKFIKK